ncbi:hypothetical protein RCL1_004407 [Eukaryota sp. TZLM3-RCL]
MSLPQTTNSRTKLIDDFFSAASEALSSDQSDERSTALEQYQRAVNLAHSILSVKTPWNYPHRTEAVFKQIATRCADRLALLRNIPLKPSSRSCPRPAQHRNHNQMPSFSDLDQNMVRSVLSDLYSGPLTITFESVAGLENEKRLLKECIINPLQNPQLFTGLRAAPRGVILFGPPGTGKTLLAKCIAAEANAKFFSLSASSVTGKYFGDSESKVKTLFKVARRMAPSIIFIDEIDSLLTSRSSDEHDALRRLKTQFLVELDGFVSDQSSTDSVFFIGATNLPWELDNALLRRLGRRIYIPLPDTESRRHLLSNLLQGNNHNLSKRQITSIVNKTEGYSAADLTEVCKEAATNCLRDIPSDQLAVYNSNDVRPIAASDFTLALKAVKSTVKNKDLEKFEEWNREFGYF